LGGYDKAFRELSIKASTIHHNDIGELFRIKRDIYKEMSHIGRAENRYDVLLNYEIYSSVMDISNDMCSFPFLYQTKRELLSHYNRSNRLYDLEGFSREVENSFESPKKLCYWLYNFTEQYVLKSMLPVELHQYFSLEIDEPQVIEIVQNNIIVRSMRHISNLDPYKVASTISGMAGYELSKINNK